MRTIPMFVVAAALGAPSAAHADQCAVNPTAIADQAVTLIKQATRVRELCEPCGDKAPTPPFVPTSVAVANGRITLNGAVVDLAYLYVQTGPDEYRNVGALTRCGATGVSDAIRSGVPSGPAARPTPRPPLPPMPPRASTPDDLAGTWIVTLRTRLSSCPFAATGVAGPDESWTITHQDGVLVAASDRGFEVAGSSAVAAPKLLKFTLRPRQRAEQLAVELSQFLKDRFSGTVVRIEPSGARPRDPACVTLQDLSARRAP